MMFRETEKVMLACLWLYLDMSRLLALRVYASLLRTPEPGTQTAHLLVFHEVASSAFDFVRSPYNSLTGISAEFTGHRPPCVPGQRRGGGVGCYLSV